jgi:hypothetical protein
MSDSKDESKDQQTPPPRRTRLGFLGVVGLVFLNFGFAFATMKTVQHLKQQPPEPLLFDLTLRRGDGGFIACGVATAVLGLVLIGMEYRRWKGKQRS